MRFTRERKHRLPEQAYWGRVAVSFTACERNRRPMFSDPEVVRAHLGFLTEAVCDHGCVVPAYCFMPDHLHAVILGLEKGSRPKDAMVRFKEGSGDWLYEHRPQFHWQKDFHDHIVRQSEDWRNHLLYVLTNPVRANLVRSSKDWSHSGAIGTDLEQTLWDA